MSVAQKSQESPPHAKRSFGRLNNGNPSGDFTQAARCRARTRAGSSCSQPAMKNGRRCRMHGGYGRSGPKTVEGKARAARANLKHGEYSEMTLASNRKVRAFINEEKTRIGDLLVAYRMLTKATSLIGTERCSILLSEALQLLRPTGDSIQIDMASLNLGQQLTLCRYHYSHQIRFARALLFMGRNSV